MASPADITAGKSTVLSWTVTGATGLSISGIGAITGSSVQVTPTADTDYVLTASNATETVEAHATVTLYAPPTIWFAPDGARLDRTYGAVDYLSLFNANAPWSQAASRIRVFKLYAETLDRTDVDLAGLFADLRRRHIAVAIEFGALSSDTCGIGVEGFGGGAGQHYAERIRDFGGTLQYIAFDEPFYFGSIYRGPSACRWTADEVAQNAAVSVAKIRAVFPQVVVGDIEVMPVAADAPDWLDRYQTWIDAWQRATGAPLAFFHSDIDTGADWKPGLEALRRILAQRHIPFGLIYTGTFEPTTDADWANFVEHYFSDYETHGGSAPDEVIFQSWQPRPKHILPETDPTTFTYVINRYFRDRTTLTATGDASSMQGALTQRDTSAPVRAAPISATGMPWTGTGQAITFTRTGLVPTGTQYITFIVRVNNECGLSGTADFYVSGFSMDAGAAGSLSADFTNGFNNWGWSGNASLVEVTNSSLHVHANAGEDLNFNHAPQRFSVAGAQYTIQVTATIPQGSRGNACIGVVFQDAVPNEIARVSIPLEPPPIALAAAQTADDGSFVLRLSPVTSDDYVVWADYPGSDTLWPAASSHALGSAPPLSIATTSLPQGTLGAAYSQSLAAAGGHLPYVWLGFGLPPGLRLGSDGTVTGTPTAAGDYTVKVTAIDDSVPLQVDGRSITLQIR